VPVPRRPSFTDLPITTLAGVDTVGGIQSVLWQHDRGYFTLSAQLWDAMKRDDRIKGTTSTRVGALVAAPLEIKPANGKAKAARAAKLLSGDGEDDHGLWERMCPPDVIKSLSAWGNGIGLGLAQIIWQTSAGEWLPRLRVWHPQFVYFDWQDMQYVVIAREGVVRLPRIDQDPMGDGNWLLWTPYGYQYGWLDGLVRALADKYMMRGWNYRDWARSNERQGMATFGAKVPIEGDKDVKDQFTRDLSLIGSDAVIQIPQAAPDEASWGLEMIESTTKNWETFKEFKAALDVDIAVCVLGQNLTTEGGTDGGSRALGQVQNLVRIDKAIEDAGIADCIRQQVLSWWALYNFGDSELAPRPEYQVEPPADEVNEAAALKTLGEALGALKTAGAPIDVRTILDRSGVPMISEEEEAAQAAVAKEEAQARLEAMQQAQPPAQGSTPDGSGDGGGGPAKKQPPPPPPGKAALTTSARLPLEQPVKRRYEFQGLPIAVENEAGSLRQWRDPGPSGGTVGATTMLYDYGFIDGHLSGDGEELDCYVGPDPAADHVYVVHQLLAPDFKRHDEDKVFLGFASADAAKDAYLAHRSSADAFGGMSVIPLDVFKAKLGRRSGTGKIRATALGDDQLAQHQDTVDALLAFSRRASRDREVALRAARSPAGRKRARLYGDAVADRAKVLAARALAVDLVALKDQIDAAQDWDDLRRRILTAYKGMDPAKLAGIVSKARIMANLGGQVSAIKEV
jgi:phage gp29-like protein